MPVKVPVINTTGLLIFRFLIQFSRPAKARIVPPGAHKPYKVSPEGTSVIGQVGTAGVFAKDFISWRACLGDMEAEMELRHLRYFIAVAEAGSLTLAAEKRLHTAQPSLSRQIRDLEYEVGVQLMIRSVHGIELTAAGRAFLDHARLALTQAEAAAEAARRAAQPSRTLFAIGFLTGYEMDWLPAVMEILRAELPSTEVIIHSQDSPDLAAGLTHGKTDLAFLRPEKQAPGLKFRLLRKDPLIVVMPRDHALAARSSIRPQDIAGQTFIGVSPVRAPTLWAVINDYVKPFGVKPDHQAENLAMAISLVASTGGIGLFPLYSQNLLPKTVVSRPIRGTPPTVDLVIGYNEANTSPLLKSVLAKVDDLKLRVAKSGGR
jgi:LysR family hca operon transcriptional activator